MVSLSPITASTCTRKFKMSETNEKDKAEEKKKPEGKKTLTLGAKSGGTLTLGNAKTATSTRATGGSGVAVEMRRRRNAESKQTPSTSEQAPASVRTLTKQERDARARALQQAKEDEEKRALEPEKPKAKPAVKKKEEPKEETTADTVTPDEAASAVPMTEDKRRLEENLRRMKQREEEAPKKTVKTPKKSTTTDRKRNRKFTVTEILNEDYERDRGPSLAAQRRQREKEKMQMSQGPIETVKQSREVTVPETITVQELSNRMAEKSGDVVKALMKMGVMATVTQTIDADTAELIIDEFGHTIKRVSDSDIEIGLDRVEDNEQNLKPRPPIVTIMGHVDHGKTSLLDALRKANVASGEAGGITQHIGAYQVSVEMGGEERKVTFIDTPGHSAFSAMRARGANVTDIVVLVVAANDSVMPQTIEAISHAKAAEVPIIVAVNKIDLPEANPIKVKQDLLQHEIITEDMGGDVLAVEVSAKTGQGLTDLLESLSLQAEILELKANPDREAHGFVIESKMEKGKGSVATVLVNKGTLRKSDIFIAGAEWGRVRALINDRGEQIDEALPGQPVEVLGLQGSPDSGEELVVVENEDRARRISDYRKRKQRDVQAAALAGTSIEQMMANQKDDQAREHLPVIIKADVHGSVEAIIGLLNKMTEENNDELAVKPIHTGVGGITESDVTLAKASNAMIIGFNVRANAQARDLAQKEDVELRYYNIIYDVIDDAKAILSGMLSPEIREDLIGYAEIREVFNITKVGKVAGCMITDGEVRRGAKVRLLRDDVVIHEGTLKTLKRHKEEVKEVREGTECGMAFENYDDIKQGDMIECFDLIEEERKLA